MSSLVDARYLPNFFDCAPDDADFTCIYALQRQGYRRCRNRVNQADRSKADALRDAVLETSKQKPLRTSKTSLKKLGRVAKFCCCVRNHRGEIQQDSDLLDAVAKRWARQIDNDRGWTKPTARARAQTSKPAVIERLENSSSESEDDTLFEPPACTYSDTREGAPQFLFGNSSLPGQKVKESEALLFKACAHGGLFSSTFNTSAKTTFSFGSVMPRFVPHASADEIPLKEIIRQRLTLDELKSGSLYILSRKEDPGFVKICFTTSTADELLEEIRSKCRYIPEIEYEFNEVPNVKRIGQLVHSALSKERRDEPVCKPRPFRGCEERHTEWFELAPRDAFFVVNKWVTWVKENRPYGQEGTLSFSWFIDSALDNLIAGEIPTGVALTDSKSIETPQGFKTEPSSCSLGSKEPLSEDFDDGDDQTLVLEEDVTFANAHRTDCELEQNPPHVASLDKLEQAPTAADLQEQERATPSKAASTSTSCEPDPSTESLRTADSTPTLINSQSIQLNQLLLKALLDIQGLVKADSTETSKDTSKSLDDQCKPIFQETFKSLRAFDKVGRGAVQGHPIEVCS